MKRILELNESPSGQWRYRIVRDDGVIHVDWQWAGFTKEHAIQQARERFSFDAIKS
jgi:hypothetical protein